MPTPRTDFWSNCLIYAIWEWVWKGGYLVIRKSKVWFGPHFLWKPKGAGKVQQFIPSHPGDWLRRDWLIWFKGYVIRGDK